MIAKVKSTLTYGSFDLLHFGHIELLRRAQSLGLPVFVGLSTNKFNIEKGKDCFQSYDYRKKILEELKCVDLVFPEEDWNQKINDISKYEATNFVMGSDWTGKFDHLSKYVNVHYFQRTAEISSSLIKSSIRNNV